MSPTCPTAYSRIRSVNIVTLCTGNVARSVMLGYMLDTLFARTTVPCQIRTAGTHVYEGSSMSGRTRDALLGIGELGAHPYGAHRSRQLCADDVQWADVVLASEANHVRYVLTNFPDGRGKTVLLGQLVAQAPPALPWSEQLAKVTRAEPDAFFDVADPAGGDQNAYDACARHIWELAQAFTSSVTSGLS